MAHHPRGKRSPRPYSLSQIKLRSPCGEQALEPRAAIEAVAAGSHPFVAEKVAQALAKVDEALDPSSGLAQETFVDDRAITSMARLW